MCVCVCVCVCVCEIDCRPSGQTGKIMMTISMLLVKLLLKDEALAPLSCQVMKWRGKVTESVQRMRKVQWYFQRPGSL